MAEQKKLPLWITALLAVMLLALFFALGARVQHNKQTSVKPAETDVVAYEDFSESLAPPLEFAAPPELLQTPVTVVTRAGIALIIDDVGYSLNALERILNLSIPVAISVLPDAPYATEAAELAHQARQLVMLHLPMQPLSPKYRDRMTDDFLRIDMTEQEIHNTFTRNLSKVPFVEGVNNHMGSHLTQLEQPMRWVMEACRQRGLFYVDSKTSSKSVAANMASETGLAWASRREFLDHSIDEESMLKAWQRVRTCANSGRQCIIIGHPHPETVAFLEKHLTQDDMALMQPLKDFLKNGEHGQPSGL